MMRALFMAAALLATAASAQHPGHGAGSHAGQQSREIKALSDEEVKGYLTGRELDRLFARRDATAASVDAKLGEIAVAQARVRGSHLKTHLVATRVPTDGQVDRYLQLRGYGTSEPARTPRP